MVPAPQGRAQRRGADHFYREGDSLMKVIIVGCGRVGAYTAASLARQGHEVVVIDKNPQSFRLLPHGFSGRTIVGYAFDRDVLEEAGITEADALVAVDVGRQHQRRERAHRQGGLPRPGRGEPHLRPAARRDLPALRHPDVRAHGVERRPHHRVPGERQHRARGELRQRRGGDDRRLRPERTSSASRSTTCASPARSASGSSCAWAGPCCPSRARRSRRTTRCTRSCTRAPSRSSRR